MRSLALSALMLFIACADDYGNQEISRPDAAPAGELDGGQSLDGALDEHDGETDAALGSDAAVADGREPMDASVGDATTADAANDGAAAMDARVVVDGRADASTGDGGAPDPAAESFTAIYRDIIAPRCSGCHDSDERAGLNMSTRALALAELIGVPADTASMCNGQGTRVVAGNAANSLLVNKIEAPNPRCGARMPRNAPPLEAEDIAQIRRWIDQGARDN